MTMGSTPCPPPLPLFPTIPVEESETLRAYGSLLQRCPPRRERGGASSREKKQGGESEALSFDLENEIVRFSFFLFFTFSLALSSHLRVTAAPAPAPRPAAPPLPGPWPIPG